jgi:signal transduction histidine kinase
MFLTGRALQPVRRVREAAQAIGAQDLSRRLPVSGRDEFSDLAATFNAMIARLEQAFDQQKRLVADTSHELRTPLTTIKGTTSLALSGERSIAELQHSLEAVDRAADLMSRTVQDLLLLARSDSGEIEVAREPISIAEVLADAVDAVQGREGPAVDLTLPEDPPDVQGDLHSLVRVFANLLDNAMRHTPAGGAITVSSRCVHNSVICSVRDTGIGIAPEHLPHLGERFYRVDKARDRSRGGTGLGLAICRSILSAHGGYLTIESKEGKGTTVTVTLPRATPIAHATQNDKGPGAPPQGPVSTRRS